jgi:hypothetical protein
MQTMSQRIQSIEETIDYFKKLKVNTVINDNILLNNSNDDLESLKDDNDIIVENNDEDDLLSNFDFTTSQLVNNNKKKKNQDNQIITNLAEFCKNHLKLCSIDQLLDEILPNINAIIYDKTDKISKKLSNTDNNSLPMVESQESLILNIYTSLDQMYTHLSQSKPNAITTTQTSLIKFEKCKYFLLMTLKCSLVTSRFILSKNEPKTSLSQPTTMSNGFTTDLTRLLNTILIKLSNLIETKLAISYNEPTSQMFLQAICDKVVKLLNLIKESKTQVYLWKIISKLIIKNRLLTLLPPTNDLLLRIIDLLNQEIVCKLTQLKEKLFTLRNSACQQQSIDQVSQSQKPVNLELNKILKLASFHFKIFKSIVITYQSQIQDLDSNEKSSFYLKSIKLMSCINYIQSIEYTLQSSLNSTNDLFSMIKIEIIKEFKSNYEAIIRIFIDNCSCIDYLGNDFESSPFEYDELLLFYCSWLERMNSSKTTSSSSDVIGFIEKMFNLCDMCTLAFDLPFYYIINEDSCIEVYTFVVNSIANFLIHKMNETSNDMAEKIVYFLVHSLETLKNGNQKVILIYFFLFLF